MASRNNSNSSGLTHRHAQPPAEKVNEPKAAPAATQVTAGGTSGVASSTFNLAKTIVGSGILSLPSGIAGFSNSRSALGISSAILLFMALISAYGFSSIGTACSRYQAKTFGEAWERATDSKSGGFLSAIIVIKTFFGCLSFSIILGESDRKLLRFSFSYYMYIYL